MNIQDKVILITGASVGIGKAAAKLLTAKGAKVALAARSEDKLKELSLDLKDSFVIPVDMTDEASINHMVKETEEHYGHIDVLINNAGQALLAPVEEINVSDYKKIMDLNVFGPLLALQAAVPGMKANGGGMILNIGSDVSKMLIPMLAAYASTKYALNGLMLTARSELASSNIIVSIMYPSATSTGFGHNAVINTEKSFTPPPGMPVDSPEMVAEKIAEAIETEKAEQYMNDEAERLYSVLK